MVEAVEQIHSERSPISVRQDWGSEAIQVARWDLPALKFEWVRSAMPCGGGRVLEIGCNGGRFLKTLRRYFPGLELFGIDIDALAVQKAAEGEGVMVCVGDGLRLPFADESFDCIVVLDYLEHVPNVGMALQEIFRCLKKNGRLAAFIPCEGQPLSVYGLFRRLLKIDVKAGTCGHYPLRRELLKRWFIERNYRISSESFSYHLLGQWMDFGFFWMVSKSKSLSRWWWEQNSFYRENCKTGVFGRIAKIVVLVANGLCYWESRLLKRVRAGSIGWHVVISKTPEVGVFPEGGGTSYGQTGESWLDRLLCRWRYRQIVRRVPRDVAVLDLGCGYRGNLLKTLSRRIREGLGLDQSVSEIPAAPNVKLMRCRIDSPWELKDESFDVITSLALVEHLERPDVFFSECYRVLRPGGCLLMTTPSKMAKPVLEFLAFRLGIISRKEIADHKRYYNSTELVEGLRRAGFAEEDIQVTRFQCGFNLMAVVWKRKGRGLREEVA